MQKKQKGTERKSKTLQGEGEKTRIRHKVRERKKGETYFQLHRSFPKFLYFFILFSLQSFFYAGVMLMLWRSDVCVFVFLCSCCSQVVRLAVKGHGVQVHVDVRVVLAAHPADRRAVEGGP